MAQYYRSNSVSQAREVEYQNRLTELNDRQIVIREQATIFDINDFGVQPTRAIETPMGPPANVTLASNNVYVNPYVIAEQPTGQNNGVSPYVLTNNPLWNDPRDPNDDNTNPSVQNGNDKLYPSTRPIKQFAVGGSVNIVYKVQVSRDWGSSWADITNILRQPANVNASIYFELDITTIVNSYINTFMPQSLAKDFNNTTAKQNYGGGHWWVLDGSVEARVIATGEAYNSSGLLAYDPDESNWIKFNSKNYIDAIVQHYETNYKDEKRYLEDYNINPVVLPFPNWGRFHKFLSNKPTDKTGTIKECADFDDYLCAYIQGDKSRRVVMWANIKDGAGNFHWLPISNDLYTTQYRTTKFFTFDVGINWINYILDNGYAAAGITNAYTTLPTISGGIVSYTVNLAKNNAYSGSYAPDHKTQRYTERIKYEIVSNACCGKGFQRLFWKNAKGGIDGITFRGAKENMTSTSNEIWEKALGFREHPSEEDWHSTGNQFGVLNSFYQGTAQKQKINIRHNESERLVSQWFNKTELEWIKEIATAPLVWKVDKKDRHYVPQYNRETRRPVLITSAEIVWKPMNENLARIELVYNEQKQVTQR